MSGDRTGASARSLRRAAKAGGVPEAAMQFQGQRAGLVSRVIANSIDFALVVLVVASGYLGRVALQFLWNPSGFSFPAPNLGLAVIVGGALLTGYFWISWATSGRTYGDLVMGLRVVNVVGDKMRWSGALVRAVFCVLFGIGLFWVLVSGANRSVQDLVLRTSCIYDWGHRQRRPADAPTLAD